MISMDKQYRTRDGREVRIYAVDGALGKPVHGAVLERYGWHERSWDKDGLHCTQWPDNYSPDSRMSDLIEMKPKITRTYWLCFTREEPNCCVYGWADKSAAEDWGHKVGRAIAITGPHTVEFTEGEGL